MRLFPLFIIFSVVCIDYFSKIYVQNILKNQTHLILNDYMILEKTYNKGIIFSIAHSNSIFINYFILFVLTIIILYLIYIFIHILPRLNNYLIIAWSFLIGGGLGNFADRIIDNKVFDFIIVHYKDIYFPGVFNLADSFISVALIMILFEYFFIQDEKNYKI